ncbi:MAG: hypothetical protein JWP01_1749 [Myxococcales bacterium]|nr:hypothetical protein [Myxococcales bacterium]
MTKELAPNPPVKVDAKVPPAVSPAPPTNNLDAAKSAEFLRLMTDITKDWKTVCGSLLTETETPKDPPTYAKFTADAYGLLARRDKTGETGLPAVRNILALTPSRLRYAQELERVEALAQADGIRRLAIHENLLDLQAGGDIKFNTDRLIVSYMALSKHGREWWQAATPEVSEWVGPFSAYLLNGGTLAKHCTEAGFGAWAAGAKRAVALKPLLNLLKGGSLAPQEVTTALVVDGATTTHVDATDAQKKEWDDEAAKIKAEIEPFLPADGATGDDAKLKKLERKERLDLILKVSAAPMPIKDRLSADAVFMRRVAMLGEQATGQGQQSLLRALDPVEALADQVSGAKVAASGYVIHGTAVDNKQRFAYIRDFLSSHSSKDPAQNKSLEAIRMRAMTHPTISTHCRYLSAPEQQDLWKLVTRGTLEPQLSDKLFPALKAGNPTDVARLLLTMGPDDQAAMGALKDDLIFRNAIASDKMREQVVVDGVTVRPYDLCLLMWGQRPGLSKDPGQTGPAETMEPNTKPLNFDERVLLDTGLYNPMIKQLQSDLSAADSWFASGWRTDDDDVANHLDAFATSCASETFVHLIRRGGAPPGQELVAKYNAKTGSSLHSLIKSGCGEKSRRAAERVLNIAIGSESVGVIGGVVQRAGDGPEAAPMKLEQALRETPTTDKGRSIQQVVHSAAADLRRELYEGLAWNGADIEDVIEIYDNLEKLVAPQLAAVKDKTKLTVFVIELLQNAYLEIDGPLVNALDKRLSNKDGKQATQRFGLTIEGAASRKKEAQGAEPALDASTAARQTAEQKFGPKATELFEAFAGLSRAAEESRFIAAKTKLLEYLQLDGVGPAVTSLRITGDALASERPVDQAAGSALGVMKSPDDYYRLIYGITPKNHAVQIARSFKHSDGTGIRHNPEEVAGWLGVDPAAIGGTTPAPVGGAPVIDDSNRALVRSGFTVEKAKDNADAMWKILHEGGEIRLFEATLYAAYNDEEKRLIRMAFRQLSGGIDWQFYVQQAKYQQDHRQGAGDFQTMQVGGEGTDLGSKAVDGATQVKVTANKGELEAALALGTQGELNITAELNNALSQSDSWNLILRIIDRADDAQCRTILADPKLMGRLQDKLDAYSWDRVHRVLTGQDGLGVRLESRSHGDHDGTMEGMFGGTHEAGMKEDIKAYVHRLRMKFEQEEIKKARLSDQLPNEDLIGMKVAHKVREACQSLSADPEIAAILDRELSGLEATSMRGMVLNGGEESNVATVAENERDAEKIHAEIRRMQKPERDRRLHDPEYMARLSSLLYGKDLQLAISLLQSTSEEAGAQDNLAELSKMLAPGGSRDKDDVLAKLVELSPPEHERLIANPQLIASITALFHYASKEKRDIAQRILGFRKEQSDTILGAAVVTPDGAQNAAGRTLPDGERQRLAFLQETAVARLLQGASVSWNQLLGQLVEVYKMDFMPKGIAAAVPAGQTAPVAQPDGPAKVDPHAGLAIEIEQKLREGIWSRIKTNEQVKDRADSKLKMDRVEQAIMGGSDPSSFRVIEQWGAFDDDEAGVEEALRKASDDHLMDWWSSVRLDKPNGEESLATVYHRYRTAHDKARATVQAQPDAPKEMPANVKALRDDYMNYVIDISGDFEDLVLNFAGGVFSDDSKTKKDGKRSKVRQRDNEDYQKWRAIIRARIPNMPVAKLAKRIKAEDRPEDVELISNPNRKARTAHEFTEDEYTRRLGTTGAGMRVAGTERAAVTDTMGRFGQETAQAESDGVITSKEGEGLERTKADLDRAMQEFSDARAKIASIAGAIVGLVAGAIVTIITGGAGAGLAWMLVAGALSGAAGAAGTAITKEMIQGSEFDFSHEGLTSIAQGAITGMVMAGTTRLAGNMMKSLTGPATAKAQAQAMEHILNGTKPDAWQRVITAAQGLGFATGEGVLSEGLNIGIEAGMAPLDPSLWVHGWDEGVIRARHKIRDHISAAPQRLFNSGVMSALTHSVGAMRGQGDAKVQPPTTELDKVHVKGSLQWHVDRMKENVKSYMKVDDVMVMAFSSFVSQKASQFMFDKPIDWSKPEEQIFMEFLTAWQGLAPNIHADHRRLVFERREALNDQIEKFGKKLTTPQELAHYKSLNPDHAMGEVLTIDQYTMARRGMFEAALGRTEAGYGGKHTLNAEQRRIFEHWCRQAADSAEYSDRIARDPLSLDIVKAAADPVKATVPPPPPPPEPPPPPADVRTKKPNEDTQPKPEVKTGDETKPEVKPPTIDELMQMKGASEAIDKSTFSGQERNEAAPEKIAAEVQRALPFVAAQFPHGTVELLPAGAIKVHLSGDKGSIVIEIKVKAAEGNDVATFHFAGQEHAIIEISDRARDKHVERSVADLVSEIKAMREAQLAGKPLPKDGALRPGSKSTELNGNDLGNIAQLKSLLRQLDAAKNPFGDDAPNPQVVKQLNADITALLDSLGVTGMEAARIELIEKVLTPRQREQLTDRHREPPPKAKRVSEDANKDGVSDRSRVGVDGMAIPDKIPRLDNLPPEQAAAQKKFAELYEAPGGKEGMATQYLNEVLADKHPDGRAKTAEESKTFATDDAKLLSEDYNLDVPGASKQDILAARGKMNLAVHQTANAVAKLAFLMRLDQIQQTEGGGMIMVTAGGVAAGKGTAIRGNEIAKAMVERAKVIWDTAGEQNSTELPWVIAEAKKRNLTVEILYVHQRPENTWERVVSRAQKEGRMVDARLHAESYAEGARNFDAVQKTYPDVRTVIVDVTSKEKPPQEIQNLPKDALTLDADSVHQKNVEYLKKQEGLSESITSGGNEQGEKVWGPPEQRAALAELGSIEISTLPAGTVIKGQEGVPLDRNTYFVSQSDGKRMLELMLKLGPEVETRAYKKGFIIRRTTEGKLHEWYFEFNDSASKVGAKKVEGPRGDGGLPPPNAATIELWGFSGVRKIKGRGKDQWTKHEAEMVKRARDQEPLLFAGHIGISLDGGKTIIGFTPKPPEGMTMPEFLKSLMEHDAFPGILGNDTPIFHKAAEAAREHGWDTEPIAAVQLVDEPKKMEIVDQAAKLSGMKPGEHGFGYSFPKRPEERTGPNDLFASSNGFDASCVRNCGAFPEKLGVAIPEPSGNVKHYMPELEKWANEDGPKDFRTKIVDKPKEKK